MKFFYFAFLFLFSSNLIFSQNVDYLWGKSWGVDVSANLMALDSKGNVYTTCTINGNGSTDLDPGTDYRETFYRGDTQNNNYLIKMDSKGKFVWAKLLAGNTNSIYIDSSDNIFMTGYLDGIETVFDFDPGVGIYNLTRDANNYSLGNVFVLKLNSQAEFVWAKLLGNQNTDRGNFIDVGRDGSILICGNNFVSKLTSIGDLVWSKSFASVGQDLCSIKSLKVDKFGAIYLLGEFDFDLKFNSTLMHFNSKGRTDVFILKLNSDGNCVWAKSIGSNDYDHAKSLTNDNFGNIYALTQIKRKGYYSINQSTNLNSVCIDSSYTCLMKIDSLGSLKWYRNIVGSFGDNICSDEFGSLYISGTFSNNIDFDPGLGVYNLMGTDKVFYLKLGNDGEFIWAKKSNTASWDSDYSNLALKTDISNNIYSLIKSTKMGNLGFQYNSIMKMSQCSPLNTPLNVSISASKDSICLGDSITLKANGGLKYEWDKNIKDGVSFFPSHTNNYTVIGRDLNGCKDTASVIIVVDSLHNKPQVFALSSKSSICIGDSISLTGYGALTYKWDNGVKNGVSFVPPLGFGSYLVTGIDSFGCKSTYKKDIYVQSLPNIYAGIDKSICFGNSIMLNGSGANTYSWSNGAQNGVSFIPPIGINTFILSGVNNNGCKNSDTIIVTVNNLPTVEAGIDKELCFGDSINLSALNVLNSVVYSWSNGKVDGRYFTPPIGSTIYILTGRDNNGCDNIDSVQVVVHSLPTVSAGLDKEICQGDSVILIAENALTYHWDRNIINGKSFIPNLGENLYSVIGIDSFGCQNFDQVLVKVKPLPNVSAGLDTSICKGSSLILSGKGALTYKWNNNIVNNQQFYPSYDYQYFVKGTDINGCINFDTISVTVKSVNISVSFLSDTIFSNQNNGMFKWINCDNNSIIIGADKNHYIPFENGNYSVVINQDGCIDTSICLNVNSLSLGELTNDLRFLIYPNPNNGVFNVEIEQEAFIEIMNVLGELISFQKLQKGKNKIDLSNRSSGIYLLKHENSIYRIMKE